MNHPNSPSSAEPAGFEPAKLDHDVVELIGAAHAPELAPQRLVNRVRSKVMRSIAEMSLEKHSTVRAHENTWQAFLDKVEFKLLNEVDGIASYLLRLQPGAVLPAHHHPVDEECVVLEGDLRIGEKLVLKAGDFHLARKDVPHAEITTASGALIFLRGAMPTVDHVF
jgi:quercetin dioxygenase-like cupin family protein